MNEKDEEIQKLKHKLDLTTKLVEMLELRINATDQISTQHTSTLSEKDHEIRRLEEALQRERNRPVPITHPSDQSSGEFDIDKIDAAGLLCEVEQRRIKW